MDGVLLKAAFCIGLFLILFHSFIFHLIKETGKSTPSLDHAVNVNKTNQISNQAGIHQNHFTISKVHKTSQTISDKAFKHKSIKFTKKPFSSQQRKKPQYKLSDHYVETVLNKQKKFFRTCYVRYLKKNFISQGSLLLSFNISSLGIVSDVSIKGGSLKDTGLYKCMKNVVKRITFRHFSGPLTTVFYPIEFH